MDATERRERASAEAADWLARMQLAQLTQTERGQFVDWLQESSVHVAEMLRMGRVSSAYSRFDRWDRLVAGGAAQQAEVVALLDDSRAQSPRSPRVESSPARRRWPMALAAALALLAIGALPWLLDRRIETAQGERRELTLPDGSLVLLGPQTRLRVHYDRSVRQVFLDRGRALFQVARNPRQSFLVRVGETSVRALGTAFGVERQAAGVIVTVSEGKVAVTDKARAPIALTANQQVTLKLVGNTQSVRRVDSARELAWAQGRLVFDQDALADAVAQFNRYNRVQIHVEDAALAARPVSGVFDAADPESFIAVIASSTPVRVTHPDDRDVVVAGR